MTIQPIVEGDGEMQRWAEAAAGGVPCTEVFAHREEENPLLDVTLPAVPR